MRESMTAHPVCRHGTTPQDCSICQLSPAHPYSDLYTQRFESLLEEARPRLQRLARQYGVEPAAIEDAVQETFVSNCVSSITLLLKYRMTSPLLCHLGFTSRGIAHRAEALPVG
jgi:hypothetical protein